MTKRSLPLLTILATLTVGCAAPPREPAATPTPSPPSAVPLASDVQPAALPNSKLAPARRVEVVGAEAAFAPMVEAAARAATLISEAPAAPVGLFAASFLQKVPTRDLVSLGRKLHDEYGAVTAIKLMESPIRERGHFEAHYAKGHVGPMKVTIEAAAPHRIVGFWIGTPVPTLGSMKDVLSQMSALDGNVSFAVHRLDRAQASVVHELNGDRRLAIGSAFKLYVLGRLVADVREGRRRWPDVVTLDSRRVSLPSGQLHRWPIGSPLTLHTLATMMISRSDNTATDQLLFTLGRRRVEAVLAPMGSGASAQNIPIPSTREMFQLKASPNRGRAEAYLKLADAAERRQFLDGTLAQADLPDLNEDARRTPFHVSDIEWFASSHDLCRALGWLWRETATKRTAPGRALLAVNRGLPLSPADFPFIGFKGGSEPGVLSLNYLLQRKDGAWFTLSATWNHETKTLNEDRLVKLLLSATKVLAREP